MDELTMVIFKQVADLSTQGQLADSSSTPDISTTELDEIAELQKVVLEITEPAPMSYTLG
jgi:hypothetical protein